MSTNLIDNVSNNISLYYRGEVTINFVRNGKIFKKISKHNNGTAELFKVITNALAGNWSASTCPQYIQLFNKENGVYTKLLQSPQRKQSSSVKTVNTVDSKSSTLYLEFLIPRTAVSTVGVVNHVRLYSGIDDTSTFLASIDLIGDDNTIDLADNTNANLLITWTLTIGNAS